MEFDIAEIKLIADKLFAHLLQTGHATVSIDCDYYWDVPKDARRNPYAMPTDLALGQLSDDMSELKRISAGTTEPLSYALVWLSSVIREIGDEIVT